MTPQQQQIRVPARVGQVTAVPIAAGQSTTISGSGTSAYIVIATAPVNVRTRGKAGTSSYTTLTQGTGIKGAEFDAVDLQNPNTVPIIVQIWTGLSEFIDNRLIIANQSIPQVIYPTYPTANAAASVNFVDLSGTGFTDINGNQWLALYRVAILIFNIDSGTTFLLQKAGATGPGAPAVGAIYPLTSVNLPVSGNYCLNVGGANINVIASEIYSAIPA